MLIFKLITVAVLVGWGVRSKRVRLPLLLVLLGLLLQRFSCSHDERVKPDHGPVKPYDDICPYPDDVGCKEPTAVRDGGSKHAR